MTEFFLPAFQWMEVNLPGGTYLRESTYGFSFLLTAHVVAMCWFFGLILMMAGLHLPHLIQQLLPFSILFGAMLSFMRLNRTQELVAARALGISVWQFLAAPLVGVVPPEAGPSHAPLPPPRPRGDALRASRTADTQRAGAPLE